jgi:hypothetical protein
MKTDTATVFPKRRRLAVFWAVPLLLLALSALASSRALAVRAEQPQAPGGGGKERFFLEVSRRPALALGFRNALADLAWLQAIQVSGASRLTRGDYDRLHALIRTAVNFDPRFDAPYLHGAIILGDTAHHGEKGLEIAELGQAAFPMEWRFPFYGGYTHYFSLGDPAAAGRSFDAAARVPGSPAYLSLLASRMFVEGREPEAALSLLGEMIRQETDPGRIKVLERRFREVVVERDIQVMERAAEEYLKKTGSIPARFSDLVSSGLLAAVPPEPHGGRYFITPSGEIRSDAVTSRLRVLRP